MRRRNGMCGCRNGTPTEPLKGRVREGVELYMRVRRTSGRRAMGRDMRKLSGYVDWEERVMQQPFRCAWVKG